MNDPYNGNGRKSPEDDLGRSIEKEVKETIGTVAAALQDAAREVSTSLRDNESVQRTVKDLAAAPRHRKMLRRKSGAANGGIMQKRQTARSARRAA